MDKSKIFLFVAMAVGFAPSARADDAFCATHEKLAGILNEKFGEQKLGMGLAGQTAMVELFVSDKGTFTLVATNTSGVACIVGAGDSWEKADPKGSLAGL